MAANFNFPSGISGNTGQPYMILTSYESRNAIESTGASATAPHGIPKSSIALYIPPGSLQWKDQSTWSETEGAATKAAAGSAWSKDDLYGLEFLGAGIKGSILTAGGQIAKTMEKGSGMLAAQGIAVNNHMALTYKGPSQMRTHDFAFKFFPKDKQEAKELQRILKDLENGMLPRMGAGWEKISGRKLSKPYFNSPRHWTIDFYKGGGGKLFEHGDVGNTFQIKKSVITAMSVNHDPQSIISFHKDGSPVQTDLTLSFKEIELSISDDEAMEV